jgi:hypothetical protein
MKLFMWGIAFTDSTSLHKHVHQFFKCEPCFGEITLDKNRHVSSQAQKKDKLLLQTVGSERICDKTLLQNRK